MSACQDWGLSEFPSFLQHAIPWDPQRFLALILGVNANCTPLFANPSPPSSAGMRDLFFLMGREYSQSSHFLLLSERCTNDANSVLLAVGMAYRLIFTDIWYLHSADIRYFISVNPNRYPILCPSRYQMSAIIQTAGPLDPYNRHNTAAPASFGQHCDMPSLVAGITLSSPVSQHTDPWAAGEFNIGKTQWICSENRK